MWSTQYNFMSLGWYGHSLNFYPRPLFIVVQTEHHYCKPLLMANTLCNINYYQFRFILFVLFWFDMKIKKKYFFFVFYNFNLKMCRMYQNTFWFYSLKHARWNIKINKYSCWNWSKNKLKQGEEGELETNTSTNYLVYAQLSIRNWTFMS